MSYGPNYADLYRGAAGYVARIIDGADPTEMPVQQPTSFDLIVNLRTAKDLGITLPPQLLSTASEIIE